MFSNSDVEWVGSNIKNFEKKDPVPEKKLMGFDSSFSTFFCKNVKVSLFLVFLFLLNFSFCGFDIPAFLRASMQTNGISPTAVVHKKCDYSCS